MIEFICKKCSKKVTILMKDNICLGCFSRKMQEHWEATAVVCPRCNQKCSYLTDGLCLDCRMKNIENHRKERKQQERIKMSKNQVLRKINEMDEDNYDEEKSWLDRIAEKEDL